jgi:hypothetical protein
MAQLTKGRLTALHSVQQIQTTLMAHRIPPCTNPQQIRPFGAPGPSYFISMVPDTPHHTRQAITIDSFI